MSQLARVPVGRRSLVCFVLLFWFSLAAIAHANAPPPPDLSWFRFEDTPGQLQAVQVVECNTDTCQKPLLLANNGVCTVSGCLQPTQEPLANFNCRGNICLTYARLIDPNSEDKDRVRLLVQVGDRLWTSNIAPPPTTEMYGFSFHWLARFQGDSLVLAPDPSPPANPNQPIPFGQGLLITLVAETIVLALVLWQLKLDRAVWARTFVSFGLMQAVSYPMAWGLVSSLTPFHSVADRVAGWVGVAIALLYASCLYPFRNASALKLALSLVLLPIFYLVGAITIFLFSYGQYGRPVAGLPYGVAVAIAEIAIVAYEAGFLALLSRGKLSLRTTGPISLLMNGASLSVSLLIWLT